MIENIPETITSIKQAARLTSLTKDTIRYYAVIDEMKGKNSVSELCRLLGVRRTSYYSFLKRSATDPEADLKTKMLAIFNRRNKSIRYT